MTNYVLLYTGGSMGETEEAVAAIMAEWGAWYGSLGEALVDGGNPFGASKHVSGTAVGDGPVSSPAISGYTIIAAASLDDAVAKLKGHPHIKHGGQVSVHETMQM